jgi:DNA helicase-2/ATP-dependent DNA helicase PcrA
MQHKIILAMFPRAKVTLLADTNQAILPALNMDNAELIAELYGAKMLRLNKSYRSTKQINDFATSLLSDDKKYEVFERDGEAVRELSGNTKELEELLCEYAGVSQSTCVITKDNGDALMVYKELKNKFPALRLCDNKSCELSNSPIVMPLALTKGLEFDNVIVYDKDCGFSGKENEKYMYMASTRALHRLTIFKTL